LKRALSQNTLWTNYYLSQNSRNHLPSKLNLGQWHFKEET
jgi:hypothetical protein